MASIQGEASRTKMRYNFTDILKLLEESLSRFAGLFQYTIQQMTYVTTNFPLMTFMTHKFAEAINLFHAQHINSSLSTDRINDELKIFLDRVLVCVLEDFVCQEMLVHQVPSEGPRAGEGVKSLYPYVCPEELQDLDRHPVFPGVPRMTQDALMGSSATNFDCFDSDEEAFQDILNEILNE